MVLIVLLILVGVYLFFFAAPAIVSFAAVFSRKNGIPLQTDKHPRAYYRPYMQQMLSDIAFLESKGLKEVSVQARDGITLRADYLGGGFAKTAILMHGYRATPYECFCALAKALYERGFNVLFAYERGHQKSGGKHPTMGLLEQYDVLSWISWAEDHTDAEQLLLCGVSMGCSAICYASDKIKNPKVRAMVLDCGYRSPYAQLKLDCQKRFLPWPLMLPIMRLCGRLFLHIDLRQTVDDSLRHTDIPAFFLHGTADETVPVGQGIHNYQCCASKKELLLVDGANHNISFLHSSPDQKEELFAFLQKNFKDER